MGANGGSASNPNPTNARRDLMLIAGLIYHPEIGLVLFECGSTEDVQAVEVPYSAFSGRSSHY